jgi:hypothetical protein
MSAAPAAAMFKEDQKEKKRWNASLSPFLNALYRNGGY